MGMRELEKAFSIIDENIEEGFFAGEKTGELIVKSERALGLKFPPTYRRFVKKKGAGGIAGQEFYGVTTDNFISATVPNGIWFTLSTREEYSLPDDLIVIGSNDDGTYVALNAHKDHAEREADVIEWNPETGEENIVADDFGSFLLEKVTEALEL